MIIDASSLPYSALNEAVRGCGGQCRIIGCLGQRFIGAGLERGSISIRGIPGNALGAYLNGAAIQVEGNAQDAVGDTMNAGSIVIHGSVGDAAGYAMRGGAIYIQGDAGYRAGVHMKAYGDRVPVMVIGGRAGSFLGEYQAGGRIVVLALAGQERPIVGNFCGTGMHGGEIYLRTDKLPPLLPKQVRAEKLDGIDGGEIADILRDYCKQFGLDEKEVLGHAFYKLTPDSENQYHRMYTNN